MISIAKLSEFLHLSRLKQDPKLKATSSGLQDHVNREDYACFHRRVGLCDAPTFPTRDALRDHEKTHPDRSIKMFVYLCHHLIFKTDTVISVHARAETVLDAKSRNFLLL